MTIPTFNELFNQVLTDLRNRLAIRFVAGKIVLNAFAAVQAAKLKLQYLTAALIYKNIFVDTADPEALGGSLERFGRVKLGRDPLPATAGEYQLNVTGDIGATIAQGTTYKSLDNSTSPDKLFVLDSAFTFTGTKGIIQVRALDLGPDSRLAIADELQVTAPIANVESFADVAGEVTAPTEGESIENYRAAVIQAYQFEPQGGARTDYRLWAQDAAGVREVYPYAKNGEPGVIQLYVEASPADSTPPGTGIPSQAILDDVEAVVEFDPDATKPLNERGRRPLGTFDIEFLAITTIPVDVDVVDLSDVGLLTAIEASIEAFLLGVRPFIDGADDPNDLNKDKLYSSDITNIVREIAGTSATFTQVVMSVGGTPTDLYQFENGDIPNIRNVTAS